VLVADISRSSVLLYRRSSEGKWEESVIAGDLNVPARATVVDLDADGDRDVIVALLGEARGVADDLDGARRAYRHCLEIDRDHGRAIRRVTALAER